MGKVFQIIDGECYSEVTELFPAAADTVGWYPDDLLFVDAPDYVFQGWTYRNGKFYEPVAPGGYHYNYENGQIEQNESILTIISSTINDI